MLDVFGSIQAALREPLGAFLLGLIVGSYLNVVALRWGERNDVKGGRSRCSHCQRPLRWWELIPLVSYVLLRGQCARCGHRLSPRYPLVELGTAVTFTLLAGASDDLVQFVALIVVASLLIVLALIDLDQGILPDQLTLGGSTVVVLYLVATGNSSLLTLPRRQAGPHSDLTTGSGGSSSASVHLGFSSSSPGEKAWAWAT
ncbi:prepilin peptidase [Candidatus Berkelbacteria bacterium]|nr:prepilin peptidase [Candidatus Berkelbacteria bacterium]